MAGVDGMKRAGYVVCGGFMNTYGDDLRAYSYPNSARKKTRPQNMLTFLSVVQVNCAFCVECE